MGDPQTSWHLRGFRQPLLSPKAVRLTGAVGAAALMALATTACGSDDTTRAASPKPVAPTVTVTVTTKAKPSHAVTPSPKPRPKPKPQAKKHRSARPAAASGGGGWVMPDQVGKDLQASQDRIQAITGNPFFYTASEDATGGNRLQIWDRDWKVCTQKPLPGQRFTADTDIVFYVVKDWERCP